MPARDKQGLVNLLSSVQKFLLWILVIFLPISIMPFPWDYTEKGMSIVILLFTLLIGSIELIKIIWSGKILFLKRDIDFIIFALLVSFTLTTAFANDTNLSLFGYNYRLGPSFINIVATVLISFIVRSFISTKKELLTLLNMFFIGSILASLFNIISLLGGNIFGLVPKLSHLGITGYPFLGDPIILAIYNCVIIFLTYIALNIYSERDEDDDYSWFSIVTIFVNLISLSLVSTYQSAFILTLVFIFLWVLILTIIFFKDKKLSAQVKRNHFLLPLVILIPCIIMQFKVVQETVFSNTDLITPLRLSINFSWQVVAQSLTNSLKNGIIGLGLDSFGVVFTALKPISLINYDFLSAYNEVLTSLSNLGFLWLVIWLILGWYTLKDLIKDIKEYDKNLNVVILFDVLIFFLYLTSFLATYTALLRFLFFFMITMGVILRNMYKHHEVENVILKIWSMNTSQKSESNSSIASIFFTVLIVIVVLLGILKLGSMTISSLYLLRAESYISEQNKNYSEQAPVLEEEEEIVENLYRWYSLALTYDKNNPLTNKKFSAAAIDRLSILMEKYEDSDDEDILNEAVNLRKQAFEYSRNAINLSPSLYSNYNNRVQVYLGVINLGYREYIRDAISVINEAININPYDYQNYYNKAWLYYLLQNYDLALEASTQSLSIKPDYIQALLLSANINGIKGKKEIQLSYLEAIKTILEENDYQDTELYNNLVDQMESIESEDTNDSEDVPETEQ
jgi:hypothetical protein